MGVDRALLESIKEHSRSIVGALYDDDFIDSYKYEPAIDFAETVIADRLYDLIMQDRKKQRAMMLERVQAAVNEE